VNPARFYYDQQNTAQRCPFLAPEFPEAFCLVIFNGFFCEGRGLLGPPQSLSDQSQCYTILFPRTVPSEVPFLVCWIKVGYLTVKPPPEAIKKFPPLLEFVSICTKPRTILSLSKTFFVGRSQPFMRTLRSESLATTTIRI